MNLKIRNKKKTEKEKVGEKSADVLQKYLECCIYPIIALQ